MNGAPSAQSECTPVPRGAWSVLALLILMSLFNYIDRQILSATLPRIETEPSFGLLGRADAKFLKNSLATAFLVTFMMLAPLFGWLGDRVKRRWRLIGIAIIFWSLASGGSGLAATFAVLLFTRCLIGVGQAAFGPVSIALLSDVFPPQRRGIAIGLVSAAIPVGSAMGFALGTLMADSALGWRWAFYLVVPPGVALGVVCFFMKEPARGQSEAVAVAERKLGWWESITLCLGIRSYLLATAGYTAMTFVTGGIAVTVIDYVHERQGIYIVSNEALARIDANQTLRNQLAPIMDRRYDGSDSFKQAVRSLVSADKFGLLWGPLREASRSHDSPELGPVGIYFGGITAVGGLLATLTGSYLAQRMRRRRPYAEFAVSAAGAFLGLPFLLAFLFVPFPYAWIMLFLAVFGLFLNMGPVNAILANVTPPAVRSTAFALNLFLLHALGDVISPPIIGIMTDRFDWTTAYLMVIGMIVICGALWSWGCLYLERDTERAPLLLAQGSETS